MDGLWHNIGWSTRSLAQVSTALPKYYSLNVAQVQSFSDRSTEQSVRLLSLDHLGVIAARLRKDVTAPTSERENEELVDILAQVMQSRLDRGTPSPTTLVPMVSIVH